MDNVPEKNPHSLAEKLSLWLKEEGMGDENSGRRLEWAMLVEEWVNDWARAEPHHQAEISRHQKEQIRRYLDIFYPRVPDAAQTPTFEGQAFGCYDRDGKDRSIPCLYFGSYPLWHFTGLIQGQDAARWKVGLALHRDNILWREYDLEKETLSLWHSVDPIRKYMVCPEVLFEVPSTIQALHVYNKAYLASKVPFDSSKKSFPPVSRYL